MALLVRLILALSLVVQSVPGLAVQRCVGMPGAGAAGAEKIEQPVCSCCGGGDDGAAAPCPFASNGYVGCNCKESQEQEPKPLPGDPKTEQLQHLLAFVPVLTVVLPPLPLPTAMMRTGSETPPWRTSHSVQSLLCVWLI